MSRIILDFVVRRWWALLLIAAISLGIIATGQAFPFTPIALIVLVFDAQRGLIRTVRPLPVSRRAQAAAWWFIGVPLGALVAGVGQVVGAFVYARVHGASGVFDPWFVAAVVTWLGLGYTELCFLLCSLLPTRSASDWRETIGQSFVGALLGMSMSGQMLFMFIVPKTYGAVQPWHWLIFALVPVVVVLSFFAAPEMAEWRMRTLSVAAKEPLSPAGREREGLTGRALFCTTIIGRAVFVLALVIGVQVAILFRHLSNRSELIAPQVIGFAILFGSIAGESVGTRVLRALPLSTARLAALLLSVPLALGCACAAFLAVTCGLFDAEAGGLLERVAEAAAIGGAGALALAVSLHIASAARILVLIFFAGLPAVTYSWTVKFPAGVLLGGAVAMALAFVLLVRGLRKSTALYRPRRTLGMMQCQPLSAR
jgi:hypothetical protein